jgi:hypothetical protein
VRSKPSAWRGELVEALRRLQRRRYEEIDIGRMLELAEQCFGEGEWLHYLVFLKIAGCTQSFESRTNRLARECSEDWTAAPISDQNRGER